MDPEALQMGHPSQLGHYRIVEEIGHGGMGVVFRAVDSMIGRPVAIKVIRLRETSDPADRDFLRQRLFKEARTAGTLSHPGIVIIYEVNEQDELAYIVMEHVSGVTIEQMMSGHAPLTRTVVAKVVEQASAALDYAHRRRIVHRDIKPANLMLTDEGSIKVCDFGIAKIYLGDSSNTRTGMVLGTPHYMSPEQVQSKPLDGRADQYSLAVVTYQMLTGERPFQAETLETLFYKIIYQDAAALCRTNPLISPVQAQVLGRALAKDPAARFETCEAFAKEFLAANPTAEPVAAPDRVESHCVRCGRPCNPRVNLCEFCGLFWAPTEPTPTPLRRAAAQAEGNPRTPKMGLGARLSRLLHR